MDEIWKPVIGYDGMYEVSNYGNVRSYLNYQWGVKNTPHILKQCKCGRQRDYFGVNLLGSVKRVHRLVAQSFIDNPNNKPFINHKDGNKSNNKIENLEWCTAKENTQHAYETGLLNNKGEHCITSKLTKNDVVKIRKIYKDGGVTQKQIAKIWGVSRSQIGFIVTKKRWKHLKEEVSYRNS